MINARCLFLQARFRPRYLSPLRAAVFLSECRARGRAWPSHCILTEFFPEQHVASCAIAHAPLCPVNLVSRPVRCAAACGQRASLASKLLAAVGTVRILTHIPSHLDVRKSACARAREDDADTRFHGASSLVQAVNKRGDSMCGREASDERNHAP